MVQEVSPNTGTSQGEGVVVNSASLEDVALSESSDRAQSVQSLHSNVETPTPETAPSYEELQQRLEAYNHHIAHMTAQKNELLQMHKDAREHLLLLEQYQRECNEKNLSFDERNGCGSSSSNNNNNNNNNLPPNYDSVDEVQSDMAILAQRVKNITQLVDSQKQLLNQLPDANDDMRADQENLERKLNELKRNGNDLCVMATQLDTLNTNVERNQPVSNEGIERDHIENTEEKDIAHRLVPICIAAAASTSTSNGNAKTIEQKEAEIETMKTQLKRLKEMMGTIATIENHADSTTIDPNQIARNVPIQTIDSNSNYIDDEHERTPTPRSAAMIMRNSDMERNLRIIQGVSSDVRAQSERMVAEKERIIALQDEISRCSQQAAAAAQLGEDALKRHSLTPTPVPFQGRNSLNENQQVENNNNNNNNSNNNPNNNNPKKKPEYVEVCRRLQELDHQNSNQENIASTQQNNENRNLNESNGTEACNVETSSSTGAPTSQSNLTGSLHDDVSADLSSLQSNGRNSNAYSIPPSMTSWANCPHSWSYPNFLYTHPTAFISTNCAFPPPPSSNFGVPPFMSAVPTQAPPVSLFNPSTASLSTTIPTTMPPLFGPTVVDQTTLQHCINQQQMFSQAINQLNTMLWQQQREIEYLQRLTQKLQERLLRLDGETMVYAAEDANVGFRSDTMPPYTSARLTIRPQQNMTTNNNSNSNHNNNNTNTSVNGLSNRSQSEQPLVHNESGHGDAPQYQHEHQQHYTQHHHQQSNKQQQQQFSQFSSNVGNVAAAAATAGSSYFENQQQSASGASSSIYCTLNNANVTARNVRPPMQRSTSSHETAGPAPIFMNHHNNAIHQNNANLRRANASVSNSSNDANNTLNNQVPPGNRANNYWDNFKSYSRQNLLATYSNKSNEDNQQQQQQQQQQLELDDSGEYNPESPRIQQSSSVAPRPVQDLRHKCLYRQTAYRSSANDPSRNIMHGNFTFRNNKVFRFGNEARIKNFQQHRQQQQQQQQHQPNPLPLGSIITNPLHANRTTESDINSTSFASPNDDEMANIITLDTHRQLFGYPVNELDDQITAEMYGCNYEQQHPTTSTSGSASASASFNINFGNSPNNRHHGGNKVTPKFQYRMGLLTEQSMHMIESFLEHWDNADADGNQEMVLNNRQNINRYLRQLHQLQSTLRFDPNYIGPSATSDYIERQLYMREDYGDQEEPEFEQNDDDDDDDDIDNRENRHFDDDINLNRNHNLLVNNRNSRNPEKFGKKEIANSRHLSYGCDNETDANHTTFSDCTYHRRGSKNRMAGYERKCEIVEWNDPSILKNIQSNNQESMRHALSETNVAEARRDQDIIMPRSETESKPEEPQLPMSEIFANSISRTAVPLRAATAAIQQENVRTQKVSQIQENEKPLDGDDTTNCETTIDSLGAYSLAAQEHFQKKTTLKGKGKQRKSTDKKNRSQTIHEDQVKAGQQSNAVDKSEAKKNNVQKLQANNDVIAFAQALPSEEQNAQWNARGSHLNGAHTEARLNSECRALIHIVMTCLRTDLNSIVTVDNRILKLITRLTASISQNTLLNRDTPQNDDSLIMLSSDRLFARVRADITSIPIRFDIFLPWYERYLETLLLEAMAEKKVIPHFMYPIETADVDRRKDWSDFMDPIECPEFIEIERQRVWSNNLGNMENPNQSIGMLDESIANNNNNNNMERNGESDEEIPNNNCDNKADEKNENSGNNNKPDEKPSTRKKGTTAQSRQQTRGGGKRNKRNKR